MSFSNDFLFGAATAAFQVEGAVSEGGRTMSIWDTEFRTPGRISNGDTADIACDHYHRYPEDVALMRDLGLNSYRFSISWSRIFPQMGQYNPEGMQFYKKLLEELKKSGICAAVTIYHWDLPQWAQDQGGWLNRACVDWYLDFAKKCFEELDGAVALWITHNEPYCASFLGHQIGVFAPNIATVEKGLIAAHHMLLSHGKAVQLFRHMGVKGKIGITLNLGYYYPESERFTDKLAVTMSEGYVNRWFLEPLFHKRYPQEMLTLFAARSSTDFGFIKEGDNECIAAPIDFLGVNFYSSSVIRYAPTALCLNTSGYSSRKKTSMGWDVDPDALVKLLKRIREQDTDLPIYITENGSAWEDQIVDGEIHDPDRCEYLLKHLKAVSSANSLGLNVVGYYYWSIMDNFEWNEGFSKRFGIIHVDYDTLKRTPKDSYYLYQKCIKQIRNSGDIIG